MQEQARYSRFEEIGKKDYFEWFTITRIEHGNGMSMHECKGFFVTGTDTEIGKTYISSLLVQSLSQLMPTTYMKPVQTGCTADNKNVLRAPDFDYVIQNAKISTSALSLHVPYRFEPACSPHLAAEMAHATISLHHILNCFAEISQNVEGIIVEGAGGVIVPLNTEETMLDLMKKLSLPVILVTSPKLGTLNHTFLSLNVLQQHDIPIAGIIFNNSQNLEKTFIYRNNCKMIRSYLPSLPFIEIEHNAKADESIGKFCHEIIKRRP